ncbi:uncharacterized protein KGF55_001685 [Candida pseudojiufengensis]|uniref:uncharacterized protein n=1 Tax=Candida pseudojiufengensis TaxID=497109 RepID=UPI0022241C29|nr:uncharacterized protein KGF55_001685 [Candida pseudojiufengensis]KAI5964616.1 hypothetical protein KGF55_001685 [Candida pseudojiufengensis]
MDISINQPTDWKAVSIVQLIFFILLMIAFIIITILQLRKGIKISSIRGFVIFLIIFQLAKIVGGITGLILLDSSKFNQNVFIATYICDSISYGFITRSISSLVQHMLKPEQEFKNHQDNQTINSNGTLPTYDMENQKFESNNNYHQTNENIYKINETKINKKSPFYLITIIILAAVICNIYAMSNLAGDSTPDDTTKTLIKVSAILFLIGMILLIFASIFVIFTRPEHRKSCQILIITLFILITRSIYSLISGFNGINFNQPNQYMLIFGKPKYYGCLALLPEGIAGILVMILFYHW